jgi:hypothetical protein
MDKKASLPPKIIGVGFQKTGTSTLREALKLLGYSVGDNRYKLLFPILRGDWNHVLRDVARFDALEDNPCPMIYRELDRLIPDCRFILTVRDGEAWLRSVTRHIGDLRDPMHEWIYGRGKGLPKEDPRHAVAVYDAHNQAVRDYFKHRPQDLLVLDFTQGGSWEELCTFLGHPIPEVPFPHANRVNHALPPKQKLGRRLKQFKKQIKYALQIRYLDWRGRW